MFASPNHERRPNSVRRCAHRHSFIFRYRFPHRQPFPCGDRAAAQRQPAGGFASCAALRRADPGRAWLRPAGHEEQALPSAWRQIDRAAHGGRVGTQPPGAAGPWIARAGICGIAAGRHGDPAAHQRAVRGDRGADGAWFGLWGGKRIPLPLEGGGEILDACSGLSPVGMGFIVVNRAAGCGGGRDGLDFPGGGHERRGIQRGPALCKDALDGLVQTTPTGAGRTEFRKVIQGTMSPGAGAIPTPGTAPVSWSATPICNSRARCADGCSPTRSRRASGFSCARCGKKKG